jgi:hypothetical protein
MIRSILCAALSLACLLGCSSATDDTTPQSVQVPAPSTSAPATVAAPSQPAALPAPVAAQPQEMVYITNTGLKYHRSTCRHLARSQRAIGLQEAKAKGYTACAVCRPPT